MCAPSKYEHVATAVPDYIVPGVLSIKAEGSNAGSLHAEQTELHKPLRPNLRRRGNFAGSSTATVSKPREEITATLSSPLTRYIKVQLNPFPKSYPCTT